MCYTTRGGFLFFWKCTAPMWKCQAWWGFFLSLFLLVGGGVSAWMLLRVIGCNRFIGCVGALRRTKCCQNRTEFFYICTAWKARKTRACARDKKSRRVGNEAGWCWTAGRRAACTSRAECLHRTEPCSPQRTAVLGATQGDNPQHQVQ